MHLKMKYIALAALIVSIFGVYLTVQTIQASIDYWLEKRDSFTKDINSITIYCKNGGQIDGDFYLVLTFVNASFSNQTAKPYAQVDNATVKFRFLLHKGDSNQKLVYFSVNENMDKFSISISLEKMNFFDMLKPNQMYPTSLNYEWDEETNQYVLYYSN